jgi:uncharacterized protein
MNHKHSRATLSIGSIRQWHWISSAISLVGMLLFSITGITLNHAADISSSPTVSTIEIEIPASLMITLSKQQAGPLPETFRQWFSEQYQVDISANSIAQWSDEEVYLPLPRPGGDAWLSIDMVSAELMYEHSSRGLAAYLNDLHKGRNTGVAWFWFIDVFALACVVFCLTGLVLLWRYAGPRPSTWPLVGLGFVIPALLIILFVHP